MGGKSGSSDPAEIAQLVWSQRALADLARLHEFQAARNPHAAARLVQALVAAPEILLKQPKIGELLDEFAPRELRRIRVRQYELRYEIAGPRIRIVRIWHTREDR